MKRGLLALVVSMGAAELKAEDAGIAFIGGLVVGGAVVGVVAFLCRGKTKQLRSVTLSGTLEDIKKLKQEEKFEPTDQVTFHIIPTVQTLPDYKSHILQSKQAQ